MGALSDDADVCLSVTYIGPKSRTERLRKTKIGTEVAHVTRDSDTTFKVKRSRSPGCFIHCSVNVLGTCSSERGNVLTMGTYCYFALCTQQVQLARRCKVLLCPQREERGGGILWRPPAYSLLEMKTRTFLKRAKI